MFQIRFDSVELCKLESAIMGVMAGFALTVVIVLLTNQEDKYDSVTGEVAIKIFITSFFTCTYAAFIFAVGGALTDPQGKPSLDSHFWLLLAAYVFAMSSVLLVLGLFCALDAYRVQNVEFLGQQIIRVVSIISLIHFTLTASFVVNQSSMQLAQVYTDIGYKLLIAIPIVISFIGYIVRRKIRHSMQSFTVKVGNFDKFSSFIVNSCLFISLMDVLISVNPIDPIFAFCVTLGMELVFAVLLNWSMIFRPSKQLR